MTWKFSQYDENHYIAFETKQNQVMAKVNQIISELNSFFVKKDSNHAINSIMSVMKSIRFKEQQLGQISKNSNCKFTNLQVFYLLLLFPFFMVRNAYNYSTSSLCTLFSCKKDMFYRFMENDRVDWRRILWVINRQLLCKVSVRTDSTSSKDPVCLIIDDTDFPKTGRRSEELGRIYSHVDHKSILGYKGLFLCRTDGKTQTMLDFSLHGENGKNPQNRQGLTKAQRNQRFTKERDQDVPVAKRLKEYTMKKTDRAIEMVKHAIAKGIRFDYLLLDSWFTNSDFVKLIRSRHITCHLLGMMKMGNSKYKTIYGEHTAKGLVAVLQKNKEIKYSRKLKCYYGSVDAEFAGTKVRLFFCRRGKRGSWNCLLCTNRKLDFFEAYRVYSMRWSIEVFFAEAKSLLRLGKSQTRNFSSQIASISLAMIQYNILSIVKRFEAYETIGGLFRDVTGNTMELSVTDKIWELILTIVRDLAELFSMDEEELLEAIIGQNEVCQRILAGYNYRQTG